ncbi:MAG: efflux RND transporter periplasmic adaptor subunit [Planctomycetes bacterium]|nr:efflux RND transporter periplasmic adaptor subunit [Planctomycetota bacterium]
MKNVDSGRSRGAVLTKVATGIAFAGVVVLLLMWLGGAFHRKVDGGDQASTSVAPGGRQIGDAQLAPVRTIHVPRVESSVGTIRAVHETSIASKLLAKVMAVNVTAGQAIEKGDVLVELDKADLVARLEQAQAASNGARAARDQSAIEHDRIKRLVEQKAAARIEWDRTQNTLRSAQAELDRAEQAVAEAQTVLGYATMSSPITGVVVDKRVEAGDMVTPGEVLLTLYDPTRMQLVASVRESLTRRLIVGQDVRVRVDAIGRTCIGLVSEIVPEAESKSRTFSVKVTGPCPPGIYSGMFGRLLIPLDDEEVVVVPNGAVRRIGQLTVVDLAQDGTLHRRAVQLGRRFGDDVEVLSGLQVGERVAIVATDPGSER